MILDRDQRLFVLLQKHVFEGCTQITVVRDWQERGHQPLGWMPAGCLREFRRAGAKMLRHWLAVKHKG